MNKNAETTWIKLLKEVDHLITAFRDDLHKHDRAALEADPESPFIHITRETGTVYVRMIPAEAYPGPGELVKYIFSHVGRDHILDGGRHMIDHEAREHQNGGRRHWLHCEPTRGTVKEITPEQATRIYDEYRQRIRRQWRQQEQKQTG